MFTYDEWGNMMFHITTGKSGIELLKEMGFKNPPEEEYEKHMASFRELRKKENERFLKWLNRFAEELCKS